MPQNTSTTSRPAVVPAPGPGPEPLPELLEGVGDVVLAGHSTGYPHLAVRPTPTPGQLAAAARDAAADPPAAGWHSPGQWQPVPSGSRPGTATHIRLSVAILPPNAFLALPAGAASGNGGPRTAAVHMARGRAHLVATKADGAMTAVQRLTTERGHVLGARCGHHLINTGDGTAVVVHAHG